MTHEGEPASADAPRSAKNWLIGDPLPTSTLEGQLLPKHLALPIFASDPLSSVAYAPQELLMILLLGGLAFLSFAPWVAGAVVLVFGVVDAVVVPPLLPQAASRMPSASGVMKVVANLTRDLLVGWESSAGWARGVTGS